MNANTPVLVDYLALAKKYQVQDITVRAYAGRISKVSGIKVAPSQIVDMMENGLMQDMKRETRMVVRKMGKWVTKEVGENTLNQINKLAAPHIEILLMMHIIGFIPAPILLREFKPTKKILNETAGVPTAKWEKILEAIEAHKSKGTVKHKVERKVPVRRDFGVPKIVGNVLPPNTTITEGAVEQRIIMAISEAAGKVWGRLSENGGPAVPKLAMSKPYTKRQLRGLKTKLANSKQFMSLPDGDFIEESDKEYSIYLQWTGVQNPGDQWSVSINQDGVIEIGLDM